MTTDEFINDEVFLDIISILCTSIRRQESIWDHPDWQVLLSLDGFTSHVNVLNAHEIFKVFKIMAIKQEGDTSHVFQAYGQQVERYDKMHVRTAHNILNPIIGQIMDKW